MSFGTGRCDDTKLQDIAVQGGVIQALESNGLQT